MTTRDDLEFIRHCAIRGHVFWSYHANMRLAERSINSEMVLQSVQRCEIIEEYPTDFPLPSCLCLGSDPENHPLHYVIALDKPADTIRIITAYRPDPGKWRLDFRTRTEKEL